MYDYNIISIDYIKLGFQLPISEERQQKTDTCWGILIAWF